jgi:hypothetical protein
MVQKRKPSAATVSGKPRPLITDDPRRQPGTVIYTADDGTVQFEWGPLPQWSGTAEDWFSEARVNFPKRDDETVPQYLKWLVGEAKKAGVKHATHATFRKLYYLKKKPKK